ncbi:MAG: ATP-dependent DNA helicase RecG, partial [Gammaproteobacteria bacterium]|nr:ATP-dependent DNA helicase RecG [Gammaproteobacteria bacterium]
MAERLARLGISRVLDLLLHVPLRYQDRTRVSRIGAARVGEDVVIEGVVEHTAVVARRRRSLLCRVADGTGSVTLRFFHFNAGQRDALRRGRRLRCIGELRSLGGVL